MIYQTDLVAFRVYMQLLRVCNLVFFVGYSLGLCSGATLHACLFCLRGGRCSFFIIMLQTLRHRHIAVY